MKSHEHFLSILLGQLCIGGTLGIIIYAACSPLGKLNPNPPMAVSERVVLVDRGTQETTWVDPGQIIVQSSGTIWVYGFLWTEITTAEGEPMTAGDILRSISSLPDTLYYNGHK